MTAAPVTRVVFTDANILINLSHIERLDLLGLLDGFELIVPEPMARFLREARRVLGEGNLLNLTGLFVLAIRLGILTVEGRRLLQGCACEASVRDEDRLLP